MPSKWCHVLVKRQDLGGDGVSFSDVYWKGCGLGLNI